MQTDWESALTGSRPLPLKQQKKAAPLLSVKTQGGNDMETVRISPHTFKATSWSGGVTREILILPQGAQYGRRDFICRISTAIVESAESVFTDLPGYTRFIMPLNGEMTLSIESVRHHLNPFDVLRFDGGASTTSLSRPNLQDLNLMVLKGNEADLTVIRPKDRPILQREAAQVFIRIRTGTGGVFHEFTDVLLKPQDTELILPALTEQEMGILITLPQDAV